MSITPEERASKIITDYRIGEPIEAAIAAAIRAAENDALERASQAALEQRCERGTAWDIAILAVAVSINRLKHGNAP